MLPTLIHTKGAKPAQFIGFSLRAADGVTVDANGQERTIAKKSGDEKTFEDTGGEQSAGLGPGRSLRWHQQEPPGQRFYLYFLCRTGHQKGYEYVSPVMTYVVDVNRAKIDMEPVAQVAAVRTYQSKDGWGHDMSWIRSRAMITLKKDDAITIGCTEKYAFVTRGLLVSEDAHALTRRVGRATQARERLTEADELLTRIAEVFATPAVREACASSVELLQSTRTALDRLQSDVAHAAQRVEAGEALQVADIKRQAEKVADDFEQAGRTINARMREPLNALAPELRDRIEKAKRPADTTSHHRRQAQYFAEVAGQYLTAAENRSVSKGDIPGLRHGATYFWRAQEFVAKAEAELALIREEKARPVRPEAKVEPTRRRDVILNGEWEMTTKGGVDAPADGDWFKVRVPHGPWRETVGSFMALDRKWPGGQHWAWYRTRFSMPSDWTAGRLKLHFEAVLHLCEVYVNDELCSRHMGGFDAFEVDVTDVARPGETNELLCFVHDTSITALPKSDRRDEPKGCSSGPNHYLISDLWGQRFGGIWQDVSLLNVPAVRVEDVFVITSVREKRISVKTRLRNETGETVRVSVVQDALAGGKPALTLPARDITLTPQSVRECEVAVAWEDARPWGIGGQWGDPKNLYHLRSRLRRSAGGRTLDTHYQRFGFREFWIEHGQFHLNGKRLSLQGGGNWYLQEGKIAHGNRWFGLHMYRSERGMNVNIQRWHRHGDIAREFFDLGDELGMLSEPEGSYWGVYGIPDIVGRTDWDDPVWLGNLTEHYRKWARKHRNHPSIVLWSIENETFCSTQRPKAMVDRFVGFGRALNEEDPTRPVTFHGVENGGYCTKRDDIQVVNLHYPPKGRVKEWKHKWDGRPCIDGEFQNYPVLFAMSGPDAQKSGEAVDKMCEYVKSWTSYYDEIELSGALNFLPYLCGLFTTADRSLMGPWGDLLPDPGTAPVSKSGWRKGSVGMGVWVPITWPSRSGPGVKCERLRTGSGNRSLINWFDPSRASVTPNKAYQAFADCWRKMPRLEARRAPEVIVRVTRAGKPVVGLPVMATPTSEATPAPRGAVTDPQGAAWIVFQQAGPYEIRCAGANARFQAKWLDTYAKPGYEDVPRLELELP